MYMLDDDNSRNVINPFVIKDINLPGTWSKPYPIDVNTNIKDMPIMDDNSRPAICDVAMTAGDNTISVCDPKPPNCPMQRMLEPRRFYDCDLVLPSVFDTPVVNSSGQIIKAPRTVKISSVIMLLIAIYLIMMFIRS